LPTIPKRPPFNEIDYLVDRKFPMLKASKTTALNIIPDIDRNKVRQLELEAAAYKEELKKLPQPRLARLVTVAKGIHLQEQTEKAAIEEVSFWFNSASCRPIYHHWAVMSYWTLEEAILLSLDRNPEQVTAKKVKSHSGISRFSRNLFYRLKLAQRAKGIGKLFDPLLPPLFVSWAKTTGLILPMELIFAVDNAHGVHHNWKDECERLTEFMNGMNEKLQDARTRLANIKPSETPKAEVLGQRERSSMLKLIIGMAIGGYGLDPIVSRSRQTKEIADDLLKAGVSLDEDTVRKYLSEGKQLLQDRETE